MILLCTVFSIVLGVICFAYQKKISKIDALKKNLTETEAKLIEAEVRLAVANERIQERDILFEKLENQFENLSAKALKDNNEAFLMLAKNSFEAITKDANNEIDHAVKPIEVTLKLFDEKLKTLETQRQVAYTSLSEQLKIANQTSAALQEETSNLFNALRKPDVRGQWGEMQLRKTVELAGMTEHVDFEEQENMLLSEGQSIRPDMVINLPNSRTIVVDAKAPLTGYLEATTSQSKVDQKIALSSFAGQIKRHIEKLSSKNYWQQFQYCPEFVILFLPGENFLSDAFRANAELLEFGVSKRVILATPTTLIALLKAISYGWKQSRLTKDAMEIADIGKELYYRLKIFFDHFNGIGKSLAGSVDAFNKMRASATTRLLPHAKKLQELGVGSDDIQIREKIDFSSEE